MAREMVGLKPPRSNVFLYLRPAPKVRARPLMQVTNLLNIRSIPFGVHSRVGPVTKIRGANR